MRAWVAIEFERIAKLAAMLDALVKSECRWVISDPSREIVVIGGRNDGVVRNVGNVAKGTSAGRTCILWSSQSDLEEVVCRLHTVAWGGEVAFGDLRSCTNRDGQIGSSRYARWEECCCLDVRVRAQIFRTRFPPEPNVRYCPRVQCSRLQTAGLLIQSNSLIDPTVSINYLSRATPYQSNGRSKVFWGC